MSLCIKGLNTDSSRCLMLNKDSRGKSLIPPFWVLSITMFVNGNWLFCLILIVGEDMYKTRTCGKNKYLPSTK